LIKRKRSEGGNIKEKSKGSKVTRGNWVVRFGETHSRGGFLLSLSQKKKKKMITGKKHRKKVVWEGEQQTGKPSALEAYKEGVGIR